MEYALVIRWLAAYVVLVGVGLPVAARLFPRAAGRGAGFALPISLSLLSIPAYLVGQLTFGPVALAAGVVTLALVAAVAAVDRDALRAGRVRIAVDLDWTAIRETLVVFTLAFVFVVAIRALDPAVHAVGGEKFLDFGLLKSLGRATSLPPEDMWFAGEPVRYYYGGHLVATLLTWLTATPTAYAYNLALAGFYATLVTAAFDLGGAIAAARGVSRRAAGVFAAFFVGIASNLAPLVKATLGVLPAGVSRPLAGQFAAATTYEVDDLVRGLDSFFYFDASRIIPGTINEFPLFAWLNGDLHAHMMGTTFLLLGAALGFSYYQTPATERWRRRGLVFVAVPLVGGFQAVVDTWSFPTVFGLLALSLVFAPASPASLVSASLTRRLDTRSWPTVELTRVGVSLAVVAAAGVVGVSLAAPFLFGAATGGNREIAVLEATNRSSLGGLLTVHGAFLAAFAVFLARRLRIDRPGVVALGVVAVAAAGVTQELAVAAIAAPLLIFGWVGLRGDHAVDFETVLVVAGAGLVSIVELVYLNEQAGPGRMNTVFKTYMHVWVLWGVAMGPILADLVGEATTAVGGAVDDVSTLGRRRETVALRNVLTVGFVVLLVLSTSVYGVVALGHHVASHGGDDPTLDATAFAAASHPEEAAAIAWLDERPGRPTLLSAPGTARNDPRDRVMYSWGANPAASLTGVPTVAGWKHEVGYRGHEAYYARVRDADEMYTGSATTRRALLEQYDVTYIWVGPSERTRYGSVSFDGLQGVSVAYENEVVTVYRVAQSSAGPVVDADDDVENGTESA